MTEDPSNENLLTVKDVQNRLRVSERTVFTLIKRGDLTGFKIGNRSWRFRESDITSFEDRQRRKAEEARSPKQPSTDEVRRPLARDGEFQYKARKSLVAELV